MGTGHHEAGRGATFTDNRARRKCFFKEGVGVWYFLLDVWQKRFEVVEKEREVWAGVVEEVGVGACLAFFQEIVDDVASLERGCNGGKAGCHDGVHPLRHSF